MISTLFLFVEFGSVFKTFTLASGLDSNEIEIDTEFKELPKSINCAGRPIREYDENKMKNQKKIISKSHGHVVGRKETSVRLGPYAEHFEDTDYIVGLTNENKVKIWVI